MKNEIINKLREEFAPFNWLDLRNLIEVHIGECGKHDIYVEVIHTDGIRLFCVFSPTFNGVEIIQHFENKKGIGTTMRFKETELTALSTLRRHFEGILQKTSIFGEVILDDKKVKQETLI